MNAQVLADFIAECSFSEEKGGGKPSSETKEGEGQEKEVSKDDHSYLQTLHVDGAAGTNQSRSGAILKGLDGLVIWNARRFNFPIINNMAEYEALVNGMWLALEMEVNNLNILNDSQLVLNQVWGV